MMIPNTAEEGYGGVCERKTGMMIANAGKWWMGVARLSSLTTYTSYVT